MFTINSLILSFALQIYFRNFRNGNQSKNGNGNSTTILVTSVMSDTYSMDYGKKGKAIIFNHHKFDGNLSAREGTNVDAANLKNTLTKLGFSVEVHQDPNYGDVYDIIRKGIVP